MCVIFETSIFDLPPVQMRASTRVAAREELGEHVHVHVCMRSFAHALNGVRTHLRIRTSVIPLTSDEKCSYLQNTQKIPLASHSLKTSNSSLKTHGAAAPRTRITWASFLSSEEPSLKLLRSAKLQRTNFSPI